MQKIAFFDTKPYDREHFDALNKNFEIVYFDSKLNAATAPLAAGCSGVCAFINDDLGKDTIDALAELGVRVIAMRSAGYNNVDFKAAYGRITIVRVPAYSPHAVAEHAMALLLTLNRKTHRAYFRTRDFNFSIVGLTGTDLFGKTAGVIGTGKIGRVFIDICRGFGLDVIAYDPYPAKDTGIEYVSLDELLARSDVISLHCPLTEETYHILDEDAFSKMKPSVFVVNTSRGALINSEALLAALNTGAIKGAALDVYEEEADYFFEDMSGAIMSDNTLALLISRPNVLITSHQAFLTEEALANIAETTLKNLDDYYAGNALENEVCYQCTQKDNKEPCRKETEGRCF